MIRTIETVLSLQHSASLCSHTLKRSGKYIRKLLKSLHPFITLKKIKKNVCVFQDQKLREVLGFGKGDNVEGKLVTIVHGNDLVNISFLNFQAMQEDTAKVTVVTSSP